MFTWQFRQSGTARGLTPAIERLGAATTSTDTANCVQLAGRLVERDALRQTPAGIDVIAFRMLHESQAMEAGGLRDVRAEVDAVAFEGQARLLAGCALDARLAVEGFLCARSRRSKRLVLHVTKLEFTEGA